MNFLKTPVVWIVFKAWINTSQLEKAGQWCPLGSATGSMDFYYQWLEFKTSAL